MLPSGKMKLEIEKVVNNTKAGTSTSAPKKQESGFSSDIALFGVALIWGINIPVMKIGLNNVDVFVFNAVRLTVSAAVLSVFAIRERRNGIRPSPKISRSQVVIFGIVISGLYQLLFLLGLERTNSGNTALIMATIPLWTAVLARTFIGERLQRSAWLGLLVALVGTLVVVLPNGNISTFRGQLVGNLLILSSALAWAGGTVYSRPLLTQISPLQLSAFASVIALPMHLLFAAGRIESSLDALQSGQLWLIILYAGVLSSGLALPMWNYGVRQAGASHAAIIQNLVPLIAIAAAWFTLSETVTAPQLIGGTLILGGLMTMRFNRNGK
jgi:drug/metabolite transporter (DMT)-like permease